MGNLSLDLIFLSIALCLSAFFNGAEIAFFSLKKSDLHRYASSDDNREKTIAGIMKTPEKILITILSGNLFVNIILTAISTGLLLAVWKEYGHFIAIAILTPLVIVLCEIFPKVISINNYEKISRKVTPLLKIFHGLFSPVRMFLLFIIDALTRIFSLPSKDEQNITEEELNMAVRMGKAEGVIDKKEETFISNVLRFSKKEAANVMIPRNKAVFIPHGSTIKEAVAIFMESGVVRAPVFKKNPDNIVGMLDSRELIPCVMGYRKIKTINKFVHGIHHFPASKELGELLKDFLEEKIQIAIVMDEYGGTAGVVTLYSILSEVMGREFIQWEEDKRLEIEIKKINSVTSVISGDMQINDFNYNFNEFLESTEAETISGYIIEHLGHFPKRTEQIDIPEHILRIRHVRQKRIERIEVIQKQIIPE